MRLFFGASIIGSIALLYAPVGARAAVFRPKAPWRFLILGALMASHFITMFIALKFTSPLATGAILTLMPLMSAGLAFVMLGQRTDAMSLTALIIASLGAVWVIFGADIAAILGFRVGRGEAIFFVGCVAHAFFNVLSRKYRRDAEPLQNVTFWIVVSTFLCVCVYGAGELASTDWRSLPPIVWLAILYLSTVSSGVTAFLLQYAIARIPPAKAIAYTMLTPAFVILIEGLAGGRWASWPVIAGAMTTVLGLAILVYTQDR